MKQALLLFITAAVLSSCGNGGQSKTINDAKQVQAELKTMQPGGIATTEGGWTMTAAISGKNWSANSIIPPDVADRIVGDQNGESISLPYDRRDMVVGEKIKFSHDNAVDLMIHDDVAIWGGYKGAMEITKVDNGGQKGNSFYRQRKHH